MFYSEAAILDFSAGASRYVSCSLFKSKEADYVLVFMSPPTPFILNEWSLVPVDPVQPCSWTIK